MSVFDYTILTGSIIGIVNSLILIVYSFSTKKGNPQTNYLFGFLVFSLTLRVSKSIILTYSDGIHNLLLTLGLSGFLAIGPAFYFYVKSITNKSFKLKSKDALHLLPALVFTFLWVKLDFIRTHEHVWHIFYRTILLQYMVYLTIATKELMLLKETHPRAFRDLAIITGFLLIIWFSYALNEVAGFPYISGAVLYSLLIYFSIIILLNKGHLIDLTAPKYAKSGLSKPESLALAGRVHYLLADESIITDNQLSLKKLATLLNMSTHDTSRVLNEATGVSFFELVASKRIELACQRLLHSPKASISDIAYGVGYNSLSAFNTAFKKRTNLTPTQYRNAHA